MHRLLAPLARLTADRPGRVLAVLAGLTVLFGVISTDQSTDTELTAFAPESELALALERVQDDFGAGASTLQVVVDAGSGSADVLSRSGIETALAVEDAIAAAVDDVDVALELDRPGAVRSYAGPVLQALANEGVTFEAASEAEIDRAAVLALSEAAAALVSNDLDPDAGSASAGLVVFTFPPGIDLDEVGRASLRIADRIEVDLADLSAQTDISVTPFNGAIVQSSLERQSEEEMPRLLSLSLLLIVVILLFQYRTISDVLIGFVGLIATVTWMFGISVLLGPGYLGLVGPFTQISIIVPVLLVGLGIDYAIHLTSRYREEQAHGQSPARSSATAVRSVGGALVLATITTIVGFLTNLASPLPPIADFGVFTAVGVLSAFVIMTTLVPSARNVLDRRRRRGRPLGRRRPARVMPHRPARGLALAIGRTSVLARRAPWAVLAVAAAISLGAAVGASQVETTFSQRDFIPADSDTGRLLDRMDELFAGDLDEAAYVLLDGDLSDPAVLAAIDDVRVELAAVPDVRATAGDVRGQLTVDAAERSGLLAVPTTAGQERAGDVARDIRAVLQPVEALGVTTVVTSEVLVVEEALDALTASQTRGIVITLSAALILLVLFYGVTMRAPVLGLITMIPSLAVVSWVLGTMWLLGISFNVLTAMVASLGIGIGVPFGIHITHRFGEDRRRYDTVDEAVRATVTHTGGAMAGSAATTAAGFGVLMLASLTPIQHFGTIVAITIIYSFVAAVLIQPSCLTLWARRRARRGEVVTLLDHERRDGTWQVPTPDDTPFEADPDADLDAASLDGHGCRTSRRSRQPAAETSGSVRTR